MLLRIFRANSVYNFLLVPLVGVLLLLKSFLTPGIFIPENCNGLSPFCQLIFNLHLPFWGAVLANFVATIIICFLLLYINAAFSFVRERTFLPTFIFMFIVYALPGLHTIQPIFFSGIFILLAFRSIFASFEKKKAISNAFDAGFFTGVAGLFYPVASLLVFLIPVSLFTLRNKSSWREYAASFLGLLLPWLYAFSFYFILNDTNKFAEIFLNIFTERNDDILHSLPVQLYFGFLILITLISSIFIMRQYDEKKISTRRYFKILFFYFATSLLFLIFPSVSFELLVILTLPLTFLITNYLTFMRRRFWAELFFTVLIIISLALQFLVR